MPRNEAGLTPKQAAFVREYLVDHNATQAAIRAGYAKRAAQEQSSRLLSKAMIRAEIARAEKDVAEKAGLTAQLVREYWRRRLEGDWRRLFNSDGTPKLPHELSDEDATVVAGSETVEGNLNPTDGKRDGIKVLKYRYRDADRVSELAGKALGLFEESQRLTGEFTVKWAE